jgi:hypothetical protein
VEEWHDSRRLCVENVLCAGESGERRKPKRENALTRRRLNRLEVRDVIDKMKTRARVVCDVHEGKHMIFPTGENAQYCARERENNGRHIKETLSIMPSFLLFLFFRCSLSLDGIYFSCHSR